MADATRSQGTRVNAQRPPAKYWNYLRKVNVSSYIIPRLTVVKEESHYHHAKLKQSQNENAKLIVASNDRSHFLHTVLKKNCLQYKSRFIIRLTYSGELFKKENISKHNAFIKPDAHFRGFVK